MEKRVKVSDACLSMFKCLKHTSSSIRNYEFSKRSSCLCLFVFFQTIASFVFHLLTTGALHMRTLCHQFCLFDCPQSYVNSECRQKFSESVTIRKYRITVNVDNRTQKAFKTAFLLEGRHQAFVPKYDLCKISDFLSEIFLFWLKKTFHNSPKWETESLFLVLKQLFLVSYFSRLWNFSKMANRANLIN